MDNHTILPLQQPSSHIVSRFLHFWGSIKVTLSLFGLVIIASILGTLIPQKEFAQFYIQHYGMPIYHLFRITGIIDVYGSWWFITVLTLLGLATTVCAYNRYMALQRSERASQEMIIPEHIVNNPNTAVRLESNLESSAIVTKLGMLLKTAGYHVKTRTDRERTYLFGEKGLLNRWGNFLLHISIVIILLGAIIGRFGFRFPLTVAEGEMVTVPMPVPLWLNSLRKKVHSTLNQKVQLKLYLRKFEVETYPNSQLPKEFRSYVTLYNNDQPEVEAIIRVNHPLTYRGITFYQNSYGTTATVKSLILKLCDRQTNNEIKTVELEIGQSVQIPEHNMQIKLAKFYPDFSFDLATKEAVSKSNQLNNPAALIEEYTDTKLVGTTWVFVRFPEFHYSGKTRFNYEITDANIALNSYSVLQVVKDPGVPLIYLGFSGLILGLMLTLFIDHRRVWILLQKTDSGSIIQLAGTSNRNTKQLRVELEKFANQIESYSR
ncbi:MAG: cytochrome c biogenesis protein ResB [bacterium]|nr:cytochrome c biogenesis protein ResB [bacterium]